MTEAQLQKSIVDYLATKERVGRLTFFAVPNGEKRNPITGAKLKAQGVRPGVPDLIVITDKGVEGWEVKTPKGRQQDSQKRWQIMLESFRVPYRLIRSIDDAKAALEAA